MKTCRTLLLALCFSLPAVTFAQDAAEPGEVRAAPTVEAPAPPPAVTVEDLKDVDVSPLKDAFAHKKAGKYGLAVVALLVFLTQLLLRFGPKLPGKVGEVMKSTWMTWAAPQVLSVVGALVSAATTGAPVDFDLIADAVLLGLAGGGFGAKAKQKQDADAAAKGASDAVKTVSDAVDIINSKKGPPA